MTDLLSPQQVGEIQRKTSARKVSICRGMKSIRLQYLFIVYATHTASTYYNLIRNKLCACVHSPSDHIIKFTVHNHNGSDHE